MTGKTFARVGVSFVSAFFLSLSMGYLYLLHALQFERTMSKSEAAMNSAANVNISLLMNCTIAAGCVACIGLTWLFYRMIR